MSHFGNILVLLSSLSGALAILVGWRQQHILWYYVLLSLVCDLLGYYPAPVDLQNWFGNTFLLGEFLLTALYLAGQYSGRKVRLPARVLVVLTALLFVVLTLNSDPYRWLQVSYKGGAILYGMLIPMLLAGFYEIILRIQTLQIERSPFFIFCAGLLLYVAGNFIIFLYTGPLKVTNKELLLQFWVLHNILNIVKKPSHCVLPLPL